MLIANFYCYMYLFLLCVSDTHCKQYNDVLDFSECNHIVCTVLFDITCYLKIYVIAIDMHVYLHVGRLLILL